MYTHGGSVAVVVDVVVVVVSVVLVKVVVVDVFVVVVGKVVEVVVLDVLGTSGEVAVLAVSFTGVSYFSSIHVVEASESWNGSSPGFLVMWIGRMDSSVVVMLVVATSSLQQRASNDDAALCPQLKEAASETWTTHPSELDIQAAKDPRRCVSLNFGQETST